MPRILRPVIERGSATLDGSTLSFLHAGPENGESMVLLHGIPESAELWRGVMDVLAAAGRAVRAPDLPGYGKTRSDKYSLSASADLIAAWLRATGGSAWLVGHDLGGGVAQIVAVRHPELVSRVTFTCAAVEDLWPVLPIRVFQLAARLGIYPFLAAAGLMEYSPYTWFEFKRAFAKGERVSPADRRRVFFDGKIRDATGRREFAALLRALTNRDTVAVAPKLRFLPMPVQLVWADRDVFTPWEKTGARLRELVPSPSVTVVEDSGHFLPLERPAEYARALLAWH